jgi:hypothetical protein
MRWILWLLWHRLDESNERLAMSGFAMSAFVISTEGRDLFVSVGYATQDFSLRSK